MKSYIYSCNNKDCETNVVKLRSEKTATGSRGWVGIDNEFRVDLEEAEEGDVQNCPICGQILRRDKLLNVGVFLDSSLMTTSQRQKMLLKRSQIHSNKPEQLDNRAAAIARQNAEFGISTKRKK